mmetsp:Transcript_30767/g.77187  ORF Transcript_30767/g.77187 Transcript_30767/m.77187 type:complete len:337 (-) Transcript_30767:2393-3403(-)
MCVAGLRCGTTHDTASCVYPATCAASEKLPVFQMRIVQSHEHDHRWLPNSDMLYMRPSCALMRRRRSSVVLSHTQIVVSSEADHTVARTTVRQLTLPVCASSMLALFVPSGVNTTMERSDEPIHTTSSTSVQHRNVFPSVGCSCSSAAATLYLRTASPHAAHTSPRKRTREKHGKVVRRCSCASVCSFHTVREVDAATHRWPSTESMLNTSFSFTENSASSSSSWHDQRQMFPSLSAEYMCSRSDEGTMQLADLGWAMNLRRSTGWRLSRSCCSVGGGGIMESCLDSAETQSEALSDREAAAWHSCARALWMRAWSCAHADMLTDGFLVGGNGMIL